MSKINFIRHFSFVICLTLLSSCIVGKGKIAVVIKDSRIAGKNLGVTVSNIQVINHQIIVTGTNLNNVQGFKVKDGGVDTTLAIESQTSTTLVANTLSNVTFAAGKILDFIFSNASAAATFTVNFSLCDSTLGGKAFDCALTPNDKEVLSYDAVSGKWKPRPVSGLSYQGALDASGAAPTSAGPSAAGDYYIISVAGNGYLVGDWAVDNGTTMDRIDNSTLIASVFGRTGAVVATEGDYNIDKLSDVTITAAASGNVLKFNGTAWVNTAETDPTVTAFAKATLPTCAAGEVLKGNGTSLSCVTDNTGAGAFTGTANRAVVTSGAGALTVATATDTEINYLSGVTSAIQTQLNAKATSASIIDWSTAGVQTIEPTRLNLTTANRVVVTSAGSVPTASTVTTTELGYVSGVTSSIQTQLNSKAAAYTGTLNRAVMTDGATGALTTSSVTNTELGYLSGVTSGIQAQINALSAAGGFIDGGNTFSATATIGTNSAHDLEIETGGTTKMTVKSDGKVGIGTNAPTALLDVRGVVSFNLGDTTKGTVAAKARGTTNNDGFYLENPTNTNSARWWIDASGVQRLDNGNTAAGDISLNGIGTGNVGIGTAAPGAKLEVAGQIKITGGSPGANKILTSDAAGLATWENPAALATGVVTTTEILDATIADADVSATAAIAQSKISGLTAALAAKEPTITAGTTAQYLRGDKSLSTFATDVINSVLTGYAAGSNTALAATDTVLQGMQKLEGQIGSKLATSSFVDWSAAGVQTLEPSRLNLTTASRAVVTSAGGVPTASSVTATELGYLSGVTSGIQAQINAIAGASGFAQNGNSYGAAATLGTNDNYDMNFETNGLTQMSVLAGAAGTVNYVTVKGATTTNPPIIAVNGSDTNIPLSLSSKGSGNIYILPGSGNVGVGYNVTNFPGTGVKLDVAGNIRATGSMATFDNSWNIASGAMEFYALYDSNAASGPITTSTSKTSIKSTVLNSSGDTRLGFYNNAGTELISMLSGGYVGIGATSPTVNLHVTGANAGVTTGVAMFEDSATVGSKVTIKSNDTGGRSYAFTSTGSANILGAGHLNIYDPTAGANRLVITSAGAVGMGGTITTNALAGANMVILSGGSVGIGNTSPGYKLDVTGDINATGCLRSSVGVASGVCVSDERLKKSVEIFDLGLDALLGITPKYFKYNGLGGHPESDKLELGVIAQDVEKTAPDLISTRMVKLNPGDKDLTEIKQVNYTAFTYVIINALKELYYKVVGIDRKLASKAEKSEIEALRAENAELKERLEKIEKHLNSK